MELSGNTEHSRVNLGVVTDTPLHAPIIGINKFLIQK